MYTNRTAPPRSGRAGWLAVGVPLTVAALFFGGLNVAALLARQSAVDQRTYHTGVGAVDVSVGAGDIQVLRGRPGQITVRRKLAWAYRRPEATRVFENGTLRLHSGCGFWSVSQCSADYTVWVPAGTSLRAHSSSGDITVDGLQNGLDLTTSSGDIHVRGGRGVLAAHTGSGSITVTATSAREVRARTGSGDADLEFTEPPDRVEAKSGSGDVDVAVPGRDGYRVTTDTGSGDRQVSVVQDPAARRSITARTGSGDVTIRYLHG